MKLNKTETIDLADLAIGFMIAAAIFLWAGSFYLGKRTPQLVRPVKTPIIQEINYPSSNDNMEFKKGISYNET